MASQEPQLVVVPLAPDPSQSLPVLDVQCRKLSSCPERKLREREHNTWHQRNREEANQYLSRPGLSSTHNVVQVRLHGHALKTQ